MHPHCARAALCEYVEELITMRYEALRLNRALHHVVIHASAGVATSALPPMLWPVHGRLTICLRVLSRV